MDYRNEKMKDLERRLSGTGGIKGYYRKRVLIGSRKQIARDLGISIYTLEKYVALWNKEDIVEPERPES